MYSILLVDDESLVKISLQNMIRKCPSFSVAGTASNGREALEFFRTRHVDAVITDLSMPVMGGVTLISKLREIGFSGPILALSNYTDFEFVRGAMKVGAFDYLLKADISLDLVQENLEKIKKQLEAERHSDQSGSSGEEPQSKQHELFHYAFRQYLTNADSCIRDELIEQAPFEQFLPAVFVFLTMDVDNVGSTPTAKFAESVATEILSDISPIFTDIPRDNELIVLIWEPSIHRQELLLSVRLQRLSRTICAYTTHTPRIFYVEHITSAKSLREYYQLFVQASRAGLAKDNTITHIYSAADVRSALIENTAKSEILRVLCFVNDNYMKRISLDDVSAHVHLSKEYLCRLFKKETGKKLFQYICDVRMQHAAEFLLNGSESVNAVSQQCGFSSPDVFSKRFKEYYGVTPAAYAAQKKHRP